jgi:hypothetical protein
VNALEIIEEIRKLDADVCLEDDKLVIRGSGNRLPDDLRDALREHKIEVMVALGAPMDRAIASVLAEIRPHLPLSLRNVPDSKLLILVNWSIINAWATAVRKLGSP